MPTLNLRAIGAIGAGLIIFGLVVMLQIRTGQRDTAIAQRDAETARSAEFAARVSAAARSFQAQFQIAARDVERRQTQISQEVSRDYQNRIAELRARYAGVVRRGQGGAGAGGAGGPIGLPAPGQPAGRPDDAAAALAREFVFNCRANAIQLEALQEWVRRQAAVSPAAVPSAPPASAGAGLR